ARCNRSGHRRILLMSAGAPGWKSERPPPFPPEPSDAHFLRSDHPRHGVKRALRVVAAVIGTGLTFVAAMAGGVLLHAGTPPARRLVASAVNELLTGTFRGKIEVVRLAGLRP